MADNWEMRQLLRACTHLARRGGQIIRQVHAQGQLGAHNKKADGDERAPQAMEANEVLTIADMRSQEAIVRSLRGMFPGLRIVGEEEEAPTELQEVPNTWDDVPELPDDFAVPAALEASLTKADTCLWVDPLDGTIEFVRGNLHHVTVLIGICVKDRPVAGVVLEPFRGDDGQGLLTYGAVGCGVFGASAPQVCPDLVLGMEAKHAERPRFKAAFAALGEDASLLVTQGSGQNLMKVLRGETSALLCDSGPSRWDTCAGEALILAAGGKVTDLAGEPYKYVEGAESYVNKEGLVAAGSPELHARFLAAVPAE